LLNSPGNFTASKLKWVKDHEAAHYARIRKVMLPGDFIALRLSGETLTTPSGLSEGILWDFQRNQLADQVLQYFGFDAALFPDVVPTCSLQGRVSPEAALATGLKAGTPIGYRAGDQPNNALSLNVLNPGEVAATGGTSGVVYGVVDRPAFDPLSRVNGFAHVNHRAETPRIGILLCINGAGILYSWLRQYVGHAGISYPEMEAIAASAPIGSDGLRILPFGNGAERMLENRNPGASILNLHFNRHGQPHLFRAGLEGIAFAFAYGVAILKDMGLKPNVLRVGNDNLFQSSVFSETVAQLLDCRIEVVETTGAIGAAKAAGVATGSYASLPEALGSTHVKKTFEPSGSREPYLEGYERWRDDLLKG
jgi:xylulokinase